MENGYHLMLKALVVGPECPFDQAVTRVTSQSFLYLSHMNSNVTTRDTHAHIFLSYLIN